MEVPAEGVISSETGNVREVWWQTALRNFFPLLEQTATHAIAAHSVPH